MKRGLEDTGLMDRYPVGRHASDHNDYPLPYHPLPFSKDDGKIAQVWLQGPIPLGLKDFKYLDTRQRYDLHEDRRRRRQTRRGMMMMPGYGMMGPQRPAPPSGPDGSELDEFKDVDKYPENVWNVEWLERNHPKANVDFNEGYFTPVQNPWKGTKFDSDDWADPMRRSNSHYRMPMKSITNFQNPGLDVYYSNAFTLNDIPYLIDQNPLLSDAPHLNKELFIIINTIPYRYKL